MAAANKPILDENNRPKITKEEVEKGMLNMIYKGLIPKYADLTPGFQRNGNPIKTSTNIRDLYGKRDIRDEVEDGGMTSVKYNFDQAPEIIKHGKNFFITDKPDELRIIGATTSKSMKAIIGGNVTGNIGNLKRVREDVVEHVAEEGKDHSLISEFHNIQE